MKYGEKVNGENGNDMSEREMIELSGSGEEEFPFMMYHPVNSPSPASSFEEMKSMMSKGWRKTPVAPSAEELIRSKIKHVEAELEVMYENLKAIEESRKKKTVEEKKERVEKAKEIVEKEGSELAAVTCSVCGKTFDTETGKTFHEMRCKEKVGNGKGKLTGNSKKGK